MKETASNLGEAETSHVSLQEEIERLVRAEHPDPFHVLGPHWIDRQEGPVIAVRAFHPGAVDVSVIASGTHYPLSKIHPDGLFEGSPFATQACRPAR